MRANYKLIHKKIKIEWWLIGRRISSVIVNEHYFVIPSERVFERTPARLPAYGMAYGGRGSHALKIIHTYTSSMVQDELNYTYILTKRKECHSIINFLVTDGIPSLVADSSLGMTRGVVSSSKSTLGIQVEFNV